MGCGSSTHTVNEDAATFALASRAPPSPHAQLAAVPMMAPGSGPLAPAGPVVEDAPPPPLVQVQAGEAKLVIEGKAFRRYEIIIYDGVTMQPVHSIFGTWNQGGVGAMLCA